MPDTFTFVSYNIRKQVNLYKEMIDLVKNNSKTIVAIQERPKLPVMADISKNLPNGVKHIYKESVNDLAIIYPSDMIITEKSFENTMFNLEEVEKRTLNVEIDFPKESISIINIHGYSKLERDHNDLNEKIFKTLNLIKKPSKHLVIGDFNMDPFEENLFNETTFMSFREKNYVENSDSKKPMYYNPSWKYMCEKDHPKGTIFYEASMVQWSMFDQVLISKDFVNNYISFEIPLMLGTKKISVSDCKSEEKFSDHMPIKLTMEI